MTESNNKERKLSLRQKLVAIQCALKAPKNQYNSFGKYSYRSCEDILEALKPLLQEQGVTLTIQDSIEEIASRIYVKATVTISDGSVFDRAETITTTAFAREPESKKGMDESQITGMASSYARKYALNGLFLIDDTKDADSMDNRTPAPTRPAPAPQPTPVEKAKLQASEAVKRYCELHGSDVKKVGAGIQKRPNYANTAEFWNSISAEFTKAINDKMTKEN